jgi:hypothetical protein
VTLLLAGHETSATALAWAFERLLRNTAVLARLRTKLAEGDEAYLDCVIKESMRSRPIIGQAIRRLSAPISVAGYNVPAGTFLVASTILLHNDPRLYPEPQTFRPERFEDGRTDPYSWIPFGGGVRRCLGASFAAPCLGALRAERARQPARAGAATIRYLPSRSRGSGSFARASRREFASDPECRMKCANVRDLRLAQNLQAPEAGSLHLRGQSRQVRRNRCSSPREEVQTQVVHDRRQANALSVPPRQRPTASSRF